MRPSRFPASSLVICSVLTLASVAVLQVGRSIPDEPTARTNPRQVRAQDPKLKKEFDYLIFDLGKGVELKLIKIAAKKKSFMIGSPNEEEGRIKAEDQHEVTFTNDYYIGVFEVTCQQFRRFVEETRHKTDAEKQYARNSWNDPGFPQTESHPANFISWNDAKEFCDWLSKKGSARYVVRLPGEAEWEYACRAGSKTKYHFGDDPEKFPEYENVADATLNKIEKGEYADHRIKGSDGFPYTSPVGNFKPNPFGVYDMHGNLTEWCEDTFGKHSDLPKSNNSIQSKPAKYRVTKGGNFSVPPSLCRSAYRSIGSPHFVGGAGGFRVAVIVKDD
jgi:sulfatase modifying factor 1